MGVIGNQGFWAFSETKDCFGGRKPKLVGVIDKKRLVGVEETKGCWRYRDPNLVGVAGY